MKYYCMPETQLKKSLLSLKNNKILIQGRILDQSLAKTNGKWYNDPPSW